MYQNIYITNNTVFENIALALIRNTLILKKLSMQQNKLKSHRI